MNCLIIYDSLFLQKYKFIIFGAEKRASAYSFFFVQVKKLLNQGMDVNVTAWGPKSKGVTPLHLAAEGGHLGVMDELLERGANIDARTKGACGCKIRLQH